MPSIQELNMHLGYVKKQFETWQPTLQDIQRYIEPYRGRFDIGTGTQNDGKRKDDERINDSATKALRTLAAGMQGGLTSPSQKWFKIGLDDQELAQFKPVQNWLELVETEMNQILRQSNFYTSTINIYREQGGFGTACVLPEEMPSGDMSFRVVTIGDYYVAADQYGTIDTLFRRDWFTAKQLLQFFGKENLTFATKQLLDNNPYTFVQVYHAVRPRLDRDSDKIDKLNKKYESVYWEAKASDIDGPLSESGYDEFPYMVPRWDVNGSNTYGYSPGWEALPSIKSLQGISEDLLIAVNKVVDPPLNVPTEIFNNVDTLPGGRNPKSGTGNAANEVTPTYQINPSIGDGAALEASYEEKIDIWFYTNLFVLTLDPKATATQVVKVSEEQLIQLGPVIQRQFSEFLTPALNRVFNLKIIKAIERNEFPVPPPEIQGRKFELEYISTLAQAQKRIGVEKLERHVGFVGDLSAIKPNVLDTLDGDYIVREHGRGMGVPSRTHVGADDVIEIRRVKAEAAAAAAEQEAENMTAQTAQTLSNAKTGEDNLLTEMAEAASEGQ